MRGISLSLISEYIVHIIVIKYDLMIINLHMKIFGCISDFLTDRGKYKKFTAVITK